MYVDMTKAPTPPNTAPFFFPSVFQQITVNMLVLSTGTLLSWTDYQSKTIYWWRRLIFFLICSSMHHNSRLKKSNKMQLYADIYLLLNYSTCFRRPSRPLSGVHKTVVAASGTDRTIWGVSFFKHDQIRTFTCTSDDGHDGHSKHIE